MVTVLLMAVVQSCWLVLLYGHSSLLVGEPGSSSSPEKVQQLLETVALQVSQLSAQCAFRWLLKCLTSLRMACCKLPSAVYSSALLPAGVIMLACLRQCQHW